MIRTRKNDIYRLTPVNIIYQKISRRIHNLFPFVPSRIGYNISISHTKKIIWFRVAKVGTRTIFNEFEKNNILLDAVHPMLVHYPPESYRNYFKFAFVRNPWDRLCSCWRYTIIENNTFGLSEYDYKKMQNFDNFVDYVASLDVENCTPYLRLQSKLIDLNNVDYLGRHETFEDDLRNIFQNLDIKLDDISAKNFTQNAGSYQNYYTTETADKIAEIYRKDIQIFNYQY